MGISLNPLHDVNSLGNAIGNMFGNTDAYIASPSNAARPYYNPGGMANPINSNNNGGIPKALPTLQTHLTTVSPVPNATGGGASTPGNTGLSPVDLNTASENIINSALGRLPGELQTAQQGLQKQYDTNLNELNSGKQQAQQNYQLQGTQNSQQFLNNKNQINDQASTGLRSLLRILGEHGAGGSSAAMYAAPDAVGQVASQQRAGAGQNFGQNQQALDTNWNNYLTGFDNSKKQLSDWLTQQQQGAQSQSEQTRQGLLQQLAALQPSIAAAQPFIDQINASADKVDQLGNFNPTYTGKSPVYTAPDVASYTVNQVGAPVLGGGGNNTSAGMTPFLSMLLGQKDKNQPNFSLQG